MSWTVEITRAEGGFVMRTRGKAGGDEVLVFVEPGALFSGLVARVPGLVDVVRDRATEEMGRRLERERAGLHPTLGSTTSPAEVDAQRAFREAERAAAENG